MDTVGIVAFFLVFAALSTVWADFMAQNEMMDPILQHSCGTDGEEFWKKLMSCKESLREKNFQAIATCIPSESMEIAEKTRQRICHKPVIWAEMMGCYNEKMIMMQDESVIDLELSIANRFRICVHLLVNSAESGFEDISTESPDEENDHKATTTPVPYSQILSKYKLNKVHPEPPSSHMKSAR